MSAFTWTVPVGLLLVGRATAKIVGRPNRRSSAEGDGSIGDRVDMQRHRGLTPNFQRGLTETVHRSRRHGTRRDRSWTCRNEGLCPPVGRSSAEVGECFVTCTLISRVITNHQNRFLTFSIKGLLHFSGCGTALGLQSAYRVGASFVPNFRKCAFKALFKCEISVPGHWVAKVCTCTLLGLHISLQVDYSSGGPLLSFPQRCFMLPSGP